MNKVTNVDPKELIALEEELYELRRLNGLVEKPRLWMQIGDRLAGRMDKNKVSVERKRYIKLALSCGWLCGAHRFYSRQKVSGVLYLMFFWTGIPFAMTLVDLMAVLPMEPDEGGFIQV